MFLCGITLMIFLSRATLGVAGEDSVTIASLRMRSDITYRFATTLISSTVRNDAEVGKEAVFEVRLPNSAFISNFTMLIDGKLYSGDVKEKEAAKKQYEKAKKRGQSAGHVAKAKPRDTQRFKVAVNVAAQSEIHFNMTYQELLQRKLGRYEHVIYIDPGQPVEDMRVDVFIVETREIVDLLVPPLRNDIIDIPVNGSSGPAVNNLAVIDRLSPKSAHVAFYPSLEEQVSIHSPQGISGQFVVSYDVARETAAGELLAVNGYFVHFFSPPGLTTMRKRVLFVLDISSSMDNEKISQLKDAMYSILSDLREGDEFNIELFSHQVTFWIDDGMASVSNSTIHSAMNYIRGLRSTGSTDINRAILRGLTLLAKGERGDKNALSMMIFLTDGHPTSGETNREKIQENVRRKNKKELQISGLAFGGNADYELVQKVAAQNSGVARKIYIDSDASLQLKGFYAEVSSPLLKNVAVTYLGNSVSEDSVTTKKFPAFFKGTELVIAGKLDIPNVPALTLSISGDDSQGEFTIDEAVEMEPSPAQPDDIIAFTEKLWAYLTIRQLLDQTVAETDPTKLGDLRARALELSLKYGFVTPLTSMVVTKPEDPELADDSDAPGSDAGSRSPSSSRRPSSNRRVSSGRGGSRGGGSSGDSDPHFIVRVKGVDKALCFDVKGKGGDIYQLFADRERGVFVNGKVFGTTVKVNGEDKFRTYFSHLVIINKPHLIVVTPTRIRLNRTRVFKWTKNSEYFWGGIGLTVFARDNVTVDIGPGISLSIVKHKFRKMQIRFLGIYLLNGEGFTSDVSGIMGEFQTKNVTIDSVYEAGNVSRAKLSVHRQEGVTTLDVGLGSRNNLAEDYRVSCWKIKRCGEGLLDYRAPDDYLVKNIRSRQVLKMSKKQQVEPNSTSH